MSLSSPWTHEKSSNIFQLDKTSNLTTWSVGARSQNHNFSSVLDYQNHFELNGSFFWDFPARRLKFWAHDKISSDGIKSPVHLYIYACAHKHTNAHKYMNIHITVTEDIHVTEEVPILCGKYTQLAFHHGIPPNWEVSFVFSFQIRKVPGRMGRIWVQYNSTKINWWKP